MKIPGVVTAKELADELGISRATVSIILRGEAKRRKISIATTERVLEAARRSHYVPNQAARTLRRGVQRTEMIGVIFPDFQFDWASGVMRGMLDLLEHKRYTPFVTMHRFDTALFRKEVVSAVQRRDDALICHPLPGLGDLYRQLARGAIPVVLLGDRPPEADDVTELSSVVWDSGPAVEAAVGHLVELGRRRIGFFGIDFPMQVGVVRLNAYRATLRAAGLPVRDEWTFLGSPIGNVNQRIDAALDRMFAGPASERPDALFVLHDGIALAVLDRLRRRDLKVPEDVAVVGMGDLPWAGHAAIGLSTVAEPVDRLGREAIATAMHLIEQPTAGPLHLAVEGCQLRARRTTLGDRWLTPL